MGLLSILDKIFVAGLVILGIVMSVAVFQILGTLPILHAILAVILTVLFWAFLDIIIWEIGLESKWRSRRI